MSTEETTTQTEASAVTANEPKEQDEKHVDSDQTVGKDASVTLPLNQVFEMVKNERRRLTIDYLRQHPGRISLGELAEEIAAIENDKSIKAISSKERKRVYVGLYQCHLPKMDDLDVVEFNKDRGWIELGPNAERLYPYVDSDDSQPDIGFPRVYLSLCGVAALILTLSAAGGIVTDVVSLVVTTGLIGVVATGALYQTYIES